MKSPFFKKYLLPGFIFQSLIIGGGYGTGRELVEFFLTQGPVGGYVNIIVAMLIWSTVLAISFELARMGKNYDYRSFLNSLLGKGWIGYEIVYIIGLILIVAVIGSASGELIRDMFELPQFIGTSVMMVVVGYIVFFGSSLIEKVMSIWSLALYAVFIILVVASFISFGDNIKVAVRNNLEDSQWFLGGVRYAAYNIGILPAILFSVRYIENRQEALVSGVMAGAIAMLPGIFLFTAMLSQYPQIVSEAVPVNLLLDKLELPALKFIFQLILFGTFIETGVGLTHGFNERIAGVYHEHNAEMPNYLRVTIAIGFLILAVFIADAVGLIRLIAEGYGALTWGFWIVFVIPVLTVGTWRIIKFRSRLDEGIN